MNAITKTPINPLRALHKKEWAENKPALFVGLIIFVGLPTLWTLLLWSLDTHAGVLPGIASMLWLVAGGLFAAVLGAQVICRDFGSPTERFLLSQPIAPSSLMRVKALTGFLLLIGLAVLIGAMELLWSSLVKGTNPDEQIPVAVYVLGTGLAMCAYWIAVGAACATRRSLTSAFASAFVLVLMVTVPVIVRIPGVNDITDLALSDQHNYRTGLFAAALVAVFGGVAALAMRWAAVTDRRLDVGPRTMAWIVGLTVIGLFVTAMREVGATQPLVTTWWGDLQAEVPVWSTAGRNRIAMTIASYQTSGDYKFLRRECQMLFDIDSDGRIKRQRRMDLHLNEKTSYPVSTIDSAGNLVWLGMSRITEPPYQVDDPWRMILQTYDWETNTPSSELELPWPVKPGWSMVRDLYCSGSWAYVLIRMGEVGPSDFSSGVVAEYKISRLSATLESTRPFRFRYLKPGLDPSWVVLKGFKSGAAIRVFARHGYDVALQPVVEPDPMSSISVQSNRFGLSVFPSNSATSQASSTPTDWQGAIGHARASPWGAIFRSERPNVLPIGNGRLLEKHSFSLIEYDVSDPTHPKRISHLTSPPIHEVTVMDDLLVISHGRGFSIAKLPGVKSP